MKTRPTHAGFTLVELMLSLGIVVLLATMLAASTGQAERALRSTRGKIEQFREARVAFEAMTSRLSQATLNTYWDYDNPQLPTRYERRSELRFISGRADQLIGDEGTAQRSTHAIFFHAPLGLSETEVKPADPAYRGLENLLNVWGYFVQFSDDRAYRPDFLEHTGVPVRWRHRLMEFSVPTERVPTYNLTSGWKAPGEPRARSYSGTQWFTGPLKAAAAGAGGGGTIRPLAENVVALILTPRLAKRDEQVVKNGAIDDASPLAPGYSYDSSPVPAAVLGSDPRYADSRTNPIHQLPPIVQVTLVAIDETSAQRLGLKEGAGDVLGLKDKFRTTKDYSRDLLLRGAPPDAQPLERQLIERKLAYRIFTSNVPIRAAKWSRDQEK